MLNGQKKWIGNGSIADYVIIWARGEDGAVGGYVVEKGTPGYEATVMTGKTALRAVWQAEITLTDVRVPAENKLAECHSFKDVSKVLDRTRYTVAWRALGPGDGVLRAGAGPRPAARAVRPADRRLPARAGQARPDARRDHRRCS